IAYLSLFLAVGILWFRTFLVRDSDVRTIHIAFAAAAVSIIAHVLLIPLTVINERGESFGALFTGDMWHISPQSTESRALALVLIGFATMLAWSQLAQSRRAGRWAIAFGGIIALLSLTVAGHTVTYTPRILMNSADIVHGIAGAFWFGGLVG